MARSLTTIKKIFIRSTATFVIALSVCAMTIGTPLRAYAAATSISPSAKISFTFDDGYSSAVTQAAPTLAKYGYTGTDYVVTGCVGMATVPNTCQANNDATYMSWDQITQLKNTYGWEIGSHSVTHPYLATSDPDDQPLPISASQVVQELTQSKADLASHGINATDFATPYGDYNAGTLAEIAKSYASQRGFADTGYNTWPSSDYLIREQQVQGGVTVSKVKGYIDTAIANNQWLVLVFHDIKTRASSSPVDYEYSTKNLDQIVAYAKSKNMAGVNVSNGLVASDVNLLPNGSFNNGISDGWITDSPANVTSDSGTNGSYPDPTSAIKLIAGTANVNLFSPQIAVNSNTSYMLKSYINVQKLVSGEVGFYVDEYDSFGRWISGQYKAAERGVFVDEINFSYKPSSANVAKASLQVYATGNSGITAYLDNAQWFPLSTTAPTPTPTPVPAPTPTNLVANGTFDNGISNGWTTDSPATITSDAGNNGSPSNPVNSLKAVASTKNTHLFSPQVLVDPAKSYSITSYLSLKQISGGEVGYYVDEYNSSGAWISGQYKSGVRSVGYGDVNIQYKPSSTSVVKASFQIIIVGNSNILAYIDDIRWFVL